MEGQEFFAEGNYTQALVKFGIILLSNSDDYKLSALSLIVETYKAMELTSEIIPYLEQVINAAQSGIVDNYASLIMASQFATQFNLSQSIDIYDNIINNNSIPDFLPASALFNKAMTYLNQLNEKDAAIELLNDYIRNYPNGESINLAIMKYNMLTGENIQTINDPAGVLTAITPVKYSLGNTYPNPFNPSTTLTYTLPIAGEISLIIYDLSGREIAEIYEGYQSAGTFQVVFEGEDLPSGVYYARLTAGNFTQTQKMLLLK